MSRSVRTSRRTSSLGVIIGSLAMLTMPALAQEEAAEDVEAPEVTAPEVQAPAEATPPAEAIPPAEATPPPAAADSSHGLLGAWRVGPTVQAPGVPHPINYGIDALYNKTWGFGFATGKYTTDAVDPAEIQIANWDVRVRWHPWAGSFFLGAAYGEQVLFGKAQKDLTIKTAELQSTVPTTIQIDATTTYLTPHLGWFAVWDSGFTAGFEIGAQIPLSTKTEMDVGFENVTPSQEAEVKSSDEYKDLEKKVDDAGKMLGKTTLPYITLLRLGWLF